jgi:hypothetical protein
MMMTMVGPERDSAGVLERPGLAAAGDHQPGVGGVGHAVGGAGLLECCGGARAVEPMSRSMARAASNSRSRWSSRKAQRPL